MHEVNTFPCELCGLVFGMIINNHIQSDHSSELTHCQYCDATVKDKEALELHMMEKHEEVVILHKLGKQVNDMHDDFVDLKNILKTLQEDNNAIKQELFVIRNNQVHYSSRKEEGTNFKRAPAKQPEPGRKETSEQKRKILLIVDSVVNSADIDRIEEAKDSIITRTK